MEKYSYRLKDSVKKDKMILNGIPLVKEKGHLSNTILNFGKFNSLIIENRVVMNGGIIIEEKKKEEKKIIKKIDLIKASKKSLVEHIMWSTSDPILKDKNLLISLKKKDIIEIINMME